MSPTALLFEHWYPADGAVWNVNESFGMWAPHGGSKSLRVAFEVLESGPTSCSSSLFPVQVWNMNI